jgi:NADPH:quinone reductase-like Zn-dependent oxidoreductase
MKSGMQAISLVKAGNTKIVDERIVGTKPSSLSYAEAAALPLTTLTAWELF